MKIILASKEKFLLDKGYDLLGIPRDKLKIGFINTAFKVVEDQVYIEYMEEYYKLMESSGIDFKQFDIKGKTEQEIVDFFADRNVVQVSGGNPFYLLKTVKETKFDLILKQLLEKGLNYIGCSSGSYIMCPTIEVGSWKLGRNRHGLSDFAALNYVPFLIKCHFEDGQKEELAQKAKTLMYPLKVLKDDQCFYVENGEIRFIGNSDEIIL
jgi:peptidase E